MAKFLPLVYIFEEVRSILLNNVVNFSNIWQMLLMLNVIYFTLSIFVFYSAFHEARKKGTLMNVGE